MSYRCFCGDAGRNQLSSAIELWISRYQRSCDLQVYGELMMTVTGCVLCLLQRIDMIMSPILEFLPFNTLSLCISMK